MRRSATAVILSLVLVAWLSRDVGATLITYLAPTGQTATADFSFPTATSLQIILTETTPAAASSLTGSAAILTGVGFLLPDAAVIVLPGTVTINAGSSSVGFSLGDLAGGADVSREWGATIGAKRPIDGAGDFDFVSTNAAQVTQFAGTNRDGPAGLDGPQGGLLLDAAARGGLGVINSSIKILLTLDADPSIGGNQALTGAQQGAFLASLATSSIVEWGSNDAFGYPVPSVVPTPATLLLAGPALAGLGLGAWRLRRRNR